MEGTWKNYDSEKSYEDFIDEQPLTEEEIYNANINTYLIFTKKYTSQQITNIRNKRGEKVSFLFNPEDNNIFHDRTKLIESMIEFFIDYEEYEKCAKLQKLL